MNIIKATNKDKEAIFNIWLSCFTDDERYIHIYLEYCFPHTTTLLLGDENSGYVSVISIIPSFFSKNNRVLKGGYLYGVGTLPAYRGMSYSSRLIEQAKDLLISEGYDYFIVKPASDSLFELYRRFGFTKPIYKTNFTISQPAESERDLFKNSSEQYKIKYADITDVETLFSSREKYLSRTNFLWPIEILSYSFREILNREGYILISETTGDYCTGYPSEAKDTLQILESTTHPDRIAYLFADKIQKMYPQKNRWVIDAPFNSNTNKERTLSALLMELKPGTYSLCSDLNLSLPME